MSTSPSDSIEILPVVFISNSEMRVPAQAPAESTIEPSQRDFLPKRRFATCIGKRMWLALGPWQLWHCFCAAGVRGLAKLAWTVSTMPITFGVSWQSTHAAAPSSEYSWAEKTLGDNKSDSIRRKADAWVQGWVIRLRPVQH